VLITALVSVCPVAASHSKRHTVTNNSSTSDR
jgi:hypothetical protein